MILGVKEPQPEEVAMLRPDHLLFTYLHLAPDPELTRGLCESGATCVAYETVVDERGPAAAARADERGGRQDRHPGRARSSSSGRSGGRGVLLGGVPGVAAATVMVIGGGVVGQNAAFIAIGMEADVFVYDRNIDRLRELDLVVRRARLDGLLVHAGGRADAAAGRPRDRRGAGARRAAPYVIKRDQLGLMKERAVLVDVSIDQGGCFETSRPTTHSDPVYEVDGVTHYCVANMPGAVPVTSTFALTNATLPYVLALADEGLVGALEKVPGLKPGVNVAAGKVTHPAVAEGVGVEYTPVEEVLSVTA